MKRWVLATSLVSFGCGGDDDGGGNRDASTSDSSTNDAVANDAPASTCLPGTYDVDAKWPFEGGPYAIAGTITFPASVSSGRSVQIETIKVAPFPSGNNLKPVLLTASKTAITYRAFGLADGTWKICLRVDVNGNGSVGEVGIDYIGCFDGTTTAPIKSSSSATEILISSVCQSGKDFGVGLQ